MTNKAKITDRDATLTRIATAEDALAALLADDAAILSASTTVLVSQAASALFAARSAIQRARGLTR